MPIPASLFLVILLMPSNLNGLYQVVAEYRKRGMEFVLQAINQPSYLEDLTGLTELMKSASAFQVDWDDDETEDVDADF